MRREGHREGQKVFGRVRRCLTVGVLGAFAIMLPGCATMGKNECLNADWRSIGYEDGARGYKGYKIGEHRKACATYNVSPDLHSYNKGRLQGLVEWCTPANGYRLGKRGVLYNGVCPGQYEEAFLGAMDRGRDFYESRQKIKAKKNELARMYREREQLDEDISLMEEELIRGRVGPRQRRVLLHEIRAAEWERGQLENDISEARFNLEELQQDASTLEAGNLY